MDTKDGAEKSSQDTTPTGEPIDWDGVRAAYENSEMTVLEVIAAFNVGRDKLYRHAKQQGWVSRRQRVINAKRKAQAVRDAQHEPSPMEKRAALAGRLFNALEERIMTIEEETMQHDASHGERDAKALSAMARALDQLSEMLEQASPVPDTPAGQENDADEFRNLLTDRLNRLRDGGGGQ